MDIKRVRVPCSIIKLRMECSIILESRQASHSVRGSAPFRAVRKEILRSSILPTIRRLKAVLFWKLCGKLTADLLPDRNAE